MNTTRWGYKISHKRTDILQTGVLERTGLITDLTEMEYEDVDWVHLLQDRTQRETLFNVKINLMFVEPCIII
jgi:hypothetical protein